MRPKLMRGVEVDAYLLLCTNSQLVVRIEVNVVGLVDVKDLPPCPSEPCFGISGKELNRLTVGEVVLQERLVPPVGNPTMGPLHNLGEVLYRTPS